jgi:5-methylcytosine-specific restriction protein A
MVSIKNLRPKFGALDARTAIPAPPIKPTDAVYLSVSYRQWRYNVISRAHGECQLCGRIDKRMFADHILELKDGGSLLDVRNGQCLCGSCHTRKTLAAKARRAEQGTTRTES